MSFLSMFFIVALVIFILKVIVIYRIESKSENKILSDITCYLASSAALSSFVICAVFSIITTFLAKDYLTTVEEVINDKEIVEIQVDDRFLQDSVIIIYKDSNGDPVTYNTTLPWYCDVGVRQSEKTFVKIDSSRIIFNVYTNVLGESGDGTYTSKK